MNPSCCMFLFSFRQEGEREGRLRRFSGLGVVIMGETSLGCRSLWGLRRGRGQIESPS